MDFSHDDSPFLSDIDIHSPNDFDYNNYHHQQPPLLTYDDDDNNINIHIAHPDDNDYDPRDYDAPTDNALLFDTHDFMASLADQPHVSVTHHPDNPANYSPYDHGSPASSAGAPRSRASSVSSTHGAAFDMEHMSFASPSPAPSTWSAHSPPPPKPQSPPQLFIPGPEIVHTRGSPSPTHSPVGPGPNTLHSTGLMPAGPGIHIVPATPVSGGGGTTQPVPFQRTLETLQQGQPQPQPQQQQQQPSSSWNQDHHHHHQGGQSPSAFAHLAQPPPPPFTFPPSSTDTPSSSPSAPQDSPNQNQSRYQSPSNVGALQLGLGSAQQQQQQQQQSYLVPQQPTFRNRSKSDTSPRPPMWQLGLGLAAGSSDAATGDSALSAIPDPPHSVSAGPLQSSFSPAQLNMHQYAEARQQQQQQQQQHPHHPGLPHGMTFGPPLTTQSHNTNADASSFYLSPHSGLLGMGMGGGGGSGADLRRAKSDSAGMHAAGHRRGSRSEDLRLSHSYGAGGSSDTLFPPSSHRDFLGLAAQGGAQMQLPMSAGEMGQYRPSGGAGGLHRRSSSGGSVGGGGRSVSRERAAHRSPYPSPHASPHANANEPLPLAEYAGGMGGVMGAAGMGGMNIPVQVVVDVNGRSTALQHVGGGEGGVNGGAGAGAGSGVAVPRQNVTTHATADASQRRRRTEANFVCPVAGCGSTFTRHFNLKGHMRSHNDEKPFRCKWNGCDKGFARQHDCKRHEQLHLNIRPYVCQGCQRNFARMDALNRHLRSDAGTDCQARQPLLTSETPNLPGSLSSGGGGGFKNEPDVGWSTSASGGVTL